MAVAEYLRKRGLSAPDIYAADTKQGFVLMEDLGNDLYADVLGEGGNEPELYRAAIEALARIHAGARRHARARTRRSTPMTTRRCSPKPI